MEFLGLWILVEAFVLVFKAIGFVIGLFFRVLFFWVPRDPSPPENDRITIWIDDD